MQDQFLFQTAVLLISILCVDSIEIESGSVIRKTYHLRYHLAKKPKSFIETSIGTARYENTDRSCHSAIIVLGVGTAMHTTDYDALSRSILEQATGVMKDDSVILVVDADPRNPVKLHPAPWSKTVNSIAAELQDGTLIGSMDESDTATVCSNFTVFVGGHSASGAAALSAIWQDLYTIPIFGFIGLDPYFVGSRPVMSSQDAYSTTRTASTNRSLPSLYWGFSQTSCAVAVTHAAWAAYEQSDPGHRVLYQLQNDHRRTIYAIANSTTPTTTIADSCNFSHCCFADRGCTFVCPMQCDDTRTKQLHHDVGVSVDLFLHAVAACAPKKFSRADFESELFSLENEETILFLDDEPSRETE